jgi:group I intron endonuclease
LFLPYAEKTCGIYKIVNTAKGECYVGQSQNVRKRISEHFRLLRNGKHVNGRLQNAFNKYGEDQFVWSVEVVCEDTESLDVLEEAFIKGDAQFVEGTVYNIADFAKAPMRGKSHSDDVRAKISERRRKASFDYRSPEYRQKLEKITRQRLFSDPNFVAKVRYIIENDDKTYAERGRVIGLDTSSVRKLYLRYNNMKGVL